jgi:hypothetical protein
MKIFYSICQTTKKNRNLVDHYLKCIGKDLQLNDRGICCFQHQRFVIVIEVPKASSSFFVYTCVLVVPYSPVMSGAIWKRALEMNYLTQVTDGCTLSLDPTCEDKALEVTLSYSHPIIGLDRGEMYNIVLHFMETASNAHDMLVHAASPPCPLLHSIDPSSPPTTTNNPTKQLNESALRNHGTPAADQSRDVTPTIHNLKKRVHGSEKPLHSPDSPLQRPTTPKPNNPAKNRTVKYSKLQNTNAKRDLAQELLFEGIEDEMKGGSKTFTKTKFDMSSSPKEFVVTNKYHPQIQRTASTFISRPSLPRR